MRGVAVGALPLVCLLLGAAGFPSARAASSFDPDFQKYYPHAEAKPSSLTPAQVAAMKKLDAFYPTPMITPNGKGITDAEMAEAEAIPAYFALKRDPKTGVLSGRGIRIDDEQRAKAQPDLSKPAEFNGDFVPKIERINALYARASADQAPKLARVYADLIEHFLDQNYLPGGKTAPWMGNGYVWRDHGWKTLQMIHTLPVEMRDRYALSLALLSCFNTLLPERSYSSTDNYHCYYRTANMALAQMSDSPAKWQLIGLIRRGLDVALVGINEEQRGSLMPLDGSIIHHTGFQNRYGGYSFAEMIAMHLRWTAAGFTTPYTAATIERLRRGVIAWSFICPGNGSLPVHERMDMSFRWGGPGGSNYTPEYAKLAAQLTSAYRGTPIANDLEMAYSAIASLGEGNKALPKEWQQIRLPATLDSNSPLYTAALMGHFSHTTNGVAIQRGPDWYASIKGQHGHWRGGESHAGVGFTDHFSKLSLDGSVELIATGKDGRKANEWDSGYRCEGWDHFYYPNVTCADGAPSDLLDRKTFAFFYGTANPMGSANLRESGLWMARINGKTPVSKSAFCLGNRLVLITTDAKGAGLHTGLIQYAHHTPQSEPLVADGEALTSDCERTLAAGGDHKLFDPQGNGYFVHPDATTPAIKIRRGEQSWTYALPGQYKGPLKDKKKASYFKTAKEFLAHANDFAPTTGNYSRVWFDHGDKAEGRQLVYTVLVKPKPGELDAYAKAMANPATAPVEITRTAKAHFFHDRATDTFGAALFDASEPIDRDALLTVNRTGAYIWRRDKDVLNLSVSSADIKDTRPFEMTLAGKWTIESSEDTYRVEAKPSGDNTVVALSYRQAYPQRITLRRQTSGK